MPRSVVAGLVGVAVVGLAIGLCLAGIPAPPLCTIEASGSGGCAPNAIVCPQGDSDLVTVSITLIDQYGMPVAGQTVEVWPDPDATGFCFCSGEDLKTTTTDIDGECDVTLQHFGGCGDLGFYAECLYVQIGPSDPIHVASYDINGDCAVSLLDFIVFAGAYHTEDTCSDYDCDGTVGLTDFITFAGHYAHACE
jgi:hypothetical protein